MALSFQNRLRSYARLAVRAAVNVQPGQELLVSSDIAEIEFVRLVAEEAYEAGAKNVVMLFTDEPSTLIRFGHASEEALDYAPHWYHDMLAEQFENGAGYLAVYGANPSLLQNIDPKKVAKAGQSKAKAGERFSKAITRSASNWAIVGHASPSWAKAVFPHLSEADAVERLWEAIFACTCVDNENPVEVWNKHAAGLERKKQSLDEQGIRALRFRSPGTDLRVGLAEGHCFQGGRAKSATGIAFSPNVPTEEVFTMPHREQVDGVVRSTKPLSLRGTLIENIEMEFKSGRAIRASATAGNAVLQGLLDTDEGARHLGEVALVPNNSSVSRTNVLFLNTLFDENAACHIAMGQAIGGNLTGLAEASEEDRRARGMNTSMVHLDWMIGSGESDVDGELADGSVQPILRKGEWV
jgi:aminopeptidase